MAVSQNGWPVDPPRTSRTVPGTDVRVTVANGPAGDVLLYVLAQFDKRVEDLDLDSTRGELDDWGYANRPVRGSTSTSNHASGTAVDANATRHPLGVRNTFTPAQVAEIRRILSEVDNVVRWGGDYSGRVDEMHFEINAAFARVQAVAARLNGGGDDVGHVDTISKTAANDIAAAVFWGIPFAGVQNYASVELDNRNRDTAILQAVLALAGRKDITIDQLREVVHTATPTAADVADELRPGLIADFTSTLQSILAAVLGQDNEAQAREILRLLGEQITGATREGTTQ